MWNIYNASYGNFPGGNIDKYDCGLVEESIEQSKQIWDLRKKYVSKILLCDINKNKPTVQKEAIEFAKLDSKERLKILLEAYSKRENRMKMM